MSGATRDQTLTSQPDVTAARADEFNARGTLTLAGAHAAHDLYGGMLGPLLPAIQDKLGISLTVASLMFPAQQAPGIFQPFIGYAADRTSRRWFVVLAPAAAAISIGSIGLASHVWVVLLLLFISGLASGAFHAPAVALMGEYGGNRMSRAMSFFMSGAEVARAMAPLIITAAIAWFTLEGSAVVMVFGIAASIILYFTIDTRASDAARKSAPPVALRPLLRARRAWLLALTAIVLLNAIATGPFHYFLVKLLLEKGRGDWYAGLSLSILFFSGVAGMLLGGLLADRIGQRRTLALMLASCVPLLYLYLIVENGQWWPFLIFVPAAATLTAVRPIYMAISQEMLPEARGAMSGGLLALSFLAGSLTAFGFGAFADWIGIETAFYWIAGASLLALPFLLLLPGGTDPLGSTAASA
jgi:FSR family fosmidomycin resistance protein-like MFS transporter